MVKKIGGNITVRGEMKRGRIVLLDDANIENGSLLDITVVRTPDQLKMERQAAGRRSAAESIRFAFPKKKFSDDPIELFRHSTKTPTPKIRFDGYESTAHVVNDSVQLSFAEFLIGFKKPSAKLLNAFKKATYFWQRVFQQLMH